jgi:rhodanese-related sulfurtransferase
VIRHLLFVAVPVVLVVAACGSDNDQTVSTPDTVVAVGETDEPAIRLVSPQEGAGIIEAESPVVLDVRTPKEFDEGHVADAALIDFYEADFADRIAELDPDASYVVYCRSGNRSGQAVALMQELGFVDVADVDGGVVAWSEAGFDLVTD